MLKKSKKNKAYVICFSFASFVNIASFHQYCELPSAVSHLSFFPIFLLFFVYLSLLFHPFVSSRERHTPRLRRVLSAPCGASNSGTDFFLAGFHPSTPSLPDALKVIAATYSFPRYGRGIVAAA